MGLNAPRERPAAQAQTVNPLEFQKCDMLKHVSGVRLREKRRLHGALCRLYTHSRLGKASRAEYILLTNGSGGAIRQSLGAKATSCAAHLCKRRGLEAVRSHKHYSSRF